MLFKIQKINIICQNFAIRNNIHFIHSLSLEQLREIFEREQVSVDILSEMGHEDLKQIGITAFGHRHKLIKGLEKLMSGNGEYHS